MNFSFLQSFLAVAENGSFTAAAKELFLTQPAVSQHVQYLEEYFGVRLFIRQGKGVLLTEEGKELQDKVKNMLDVIEEAKHNLRERSELKRGKLKIAATEVISFLLPPVLTKFKSLYPGIDVHLFSHRAATIMDLTARGEVDCGLAHRPATIPGHLTERFVHAEKLVLVAPPTHNLASRESVRPADLKKEMFAVREAGTYNHTFTVGWFGKEGLPDLTMSATSMASLRGMALCGCFAFIPECIVNHDLRAGRLVQLKALAEGDTAYTYYLFTRKAEYRSKAAGVFLHMLADSGILSAGNNIVKEHA